MKHQLIAVSQSKYWLSKPIFPASQTSRIGRVSACCERLRTLTVQATALQASTPISFEELFRLLVQICSESRVLAFEVDFCASIEGRVLVSVANRELLDLCVTAVQNAILCMERSVTIFNQAPDKVYVDKATRYANSCRNRLARLRSLENGCLFDSYQLMTCSLPTREIELESLVYVNDFHDMHLLTIAQWLLHRLAWTACELSLESGPYLDALKQQLSFFTDEASHLSVLKQDLSQDNRDSRGIEVTDPDIMFVETLNSAIFYCEETISRLEEMSNIAEGEVSLAQSFTQTICNEIVWFVHRLEEDVANYVQSFSVPMDAVQLPLKTVRVLLMNEGMDNPRKKWSAVGLDLRLVAFGATEEEAVESFSTMLKLELEVEETAEPGKVNRRLVSDFEAAKEFGVFDKAVPVLQVRKKGY